MALPSAACSTGVGGRTASRTRAEPRRAAQAPRSQPAALSSVSNSPASSRCEFPFRQTGDGGEGGRTPRRQRKAGMTKRKVPSRARRSQPPARTAARRRRHFHGAQPSGLHGRTAFLPARPPAAHRAGPRRAPLGAPLGARRRWDEWRRPAARRLRRAECGGMSSPRLLCIRGGRRPITALSGSSQGAAAGQGLLELARPPPPPLLCGQRFRVRLRLPRGMRFVRRGLSLERRPGCPGAVPHRGLEVPGGAAAAGLPARGGQQRSRRRCAGWRRGCPCGLGLGSVLFFFFFQCWCWSSPSREPSRAPVVPPPHFPPPETPSPRSPRGPHSTAAAAAAASGEPPGPAAGRRAPSPGTTAAAAPPRGRQRGRAARRRRSDGRGGAPGSGCGTGAAAGTTGGGQSRRPLGKCAGSEKCRAPLRGKTACRKENTGSVLPAARSVRPDPAACARTPDPWHSLTVAPPNRGVSVPARAVGSQYARPARMLPSLCLSPSSCSLYEPIPNLNCRGDVFFCLKEKEKMQNN